MAQPDDVPAFLGEKDGVYRVENIVGVHRRRGKTSMYRVRWLGYPPEEDTFEPADNLFACRDMIEEFLAKERSKPVDVGGDKVEKIPKTVKRKCSDDSSSPSNVTTEEEPQAARASFPALLAGSVNSIGDESSDSGRRTILKDKISWNNPKNVAIPSCLKEGKKRKHISSSSCDRTLGMKRRDERDQRCSDDSPSPSNVTTVEDSKAEKESYLASLADSKNFIRDESSDAGRRTILKSMISWDDPENVAIPPCPEEAKKREHISSSCFDRTPGMKMKAGQDQKMERNTGEWVESLEIDLGASDSMEHSVAWKMTKMGPDVLQASNNLPDDLSFLTTSTEGILDLTKLGEQCRVRGEQSSWKASLSSERGNKNGSPGKSGKQDQPDTGWGKEDWTLLPTSPRRDASPSGNMDKKSEEDTPSTDEDTGSEAILVRDPLTMNDDTDSDAFMELDPSSMHNDTDVRVVPTSVSPAAFHSVMGKDASVTGENGDVLIFADSGLRSSPCNRFSRDVPCLNTTSTVSSSVSSPWMSFDAVSVRIPYSNNAEKVEDAPKTGEDMDKMDRETIMDTSEQREDEAIMDGRDLSPVTPNQEEIQEIIDGRGTLKGTSKLGDGKGMIDGIESPEDVCNQGGDEEKIDGIESPHDIFRQEGDEEIVNGKQTPRETAPREDEEMRDGRASPQDGFNQGGDGVIIDGQETVTDNSKPEDNAEMTSGRGKRKDSSQLGEENMMDTRERINGPFKLGKNEEMTDGRESSWDSFDLAGDQVIIAGQVTVKDNPEPEDYKEMINGREQLKDTSQPEEEDMMDTRGRLKDPFKPGEDEELTDGRESLQDSFNQEGDQNTCVGRVTVKDNPKPEDNKEMINGGEKLKNTSRPEEEDMMDTWERSKDLFKPGENEEMTDGRESPQDSLDLEGDQVIIVGRVTVKDNPKPEVTKEMINGGEKLENASQPGEEYLMDTREKSKDSFKPGENEDMTDGGETLEKSFDQEGDQLIIVGQVTVKNNPEPEDNKEMINGGEKLQNASQSGEEYLMDTRDSSKDFFKPGENEDMTDGYESPQDIFNHGGEDDETMDGRKSPWEIPNHGAEENIDGRVSPRHTYKPGDDEEMIDTWEELEDTSKPGDGEEMMMDRAEKSEDTFKPGENEAMTDRGESPQNKPNQEEEKMMDGKETPKDTSKVGYDKGMIDGRETIKDRSESGQGEEMTDGRKPPQNISNQVGKEGVIDVRETPKDTPGDDEEMVDGKNSLQDIPTHGDEEILNKSKTNDTYEPGDDMEVIEGGETMEDTSNPGKGDGREELKNTSEPGMDDKMTGGETPLDTCTQGAVMGTMDAKETLKEASDPGRMDGIGKLKDTSKPGDIEDMVDRHETPEDTRTLEAVMGTVDGRDTPKVTSDPGRMDGREESKDISEPGERNQMMDGGPAPKDAPVPTGADMTPGSTGTETNPNLSHEFESPVKGEPIDGVNHVTHCPVDAQPPAKRYRLEWPNGPCSRGGGRGKRNTYTNESLVDGMPRGRFRSQYEISRWYGREGSGRNRTYGGQGGYDPRSFQDDDCGISLYDGGYYIGGGYGQHHQDYGGFHTQGGGFNEPIGGYGKGSYVTQRFSGQSHDRSHCDDHYDYNYYSNKSTAQSVHTPPTNGFSTPQNTTGNRLGPPGDWGVSPGPPGIHGHHGNQWPWQQENSQAWAHTPTSGVSTPHDSTGSSLSPPGDWGVSPGPPGIYGHHGSPWHWQRENSQVWAHTPHQWGQYPNSSTGSSLSPPGNWGFSLSPPGNWGFSLSPPGNWGFSPGPDRNPRPLQQSMAAGVQPRVGLHPPPVGSVPQQYYRQLMN